MKQRTNEEELDLFADLIEPVAEILADPEIRDNWKPGEKPVKLIRMAIKNHKREIIEILARIDDVPVDEYHVSALTLPVKVMRLVNNPEVQELFTGRDQMNVAGDSGAATGNTEDGAH